MNAELLALKAKIDALPAPDKLRLAARLLEVDKPELAHPIIERVATELGAALALRNLKKPKEGGTPR